MNFLSINPFGTATTIQGRQSGFQTGSFRGANDSTEGTQHMIEAEHVLSKIHHFTFRAQILHFSFFTPQKFVSSIKFLFLVVSQKLCYLSIINYHYWAYL